MTAGVGCVALRTDDVYGAAAAPAELGVGAIDEFTRCAEPWLCCGAFLVVFS